MKKSVLKFGLFSMILLGMVSCKNKEKEMADKRISELESYVDSLKVVSAEDREANWDKIAEDFETKNANAKDALEGLDEESKTNEVGNSSISYRYAIGVVRPVFGNHIG